MLIPNVAGEQPPTTQKETFGIVLILAQVGFYWWADQNANGGLKAAVNEFWNGNINNLRNDAEKVCRRTWTL